MIPFKNHKTLNCAHPAASAVALCEGWKCFCFSKNVSKDQDLWEINKPGFSFIEIVVTVLMFGILVSALLLSVTTSYNSVTRYSNKLERIFLLKQHLFKIFLDREQGKDKPEKETKIEMPPTTIAYQLREPKGDTSLKKFEHISIEKVVATWQLQETEQTETLVSFVLKPKKEAA